VVGLRKWIEKNQSDKEEVQKEIQRLLAELQQGIEAISRMLDTAVKSAQEVDGAGG